MNRKSLFVPGKRKYVRGQRPKVDCILCSILEKDSKVDLLVLAEDRSVFVTMNLFPYNPGHVMVVPKRHVTDIRDCTLAELKAIEKWTHKLLDVIDDEYAPSGYNIGYNLGSASGASIDHVHCHIVPRFINEIGFIDTIGETRIHVDDPAIGMENLKMRLAKKGKKKPRRHRDTEKRKK
ncbi:MAG: HIT domain-containing protein [Candidatus Lindowbacteria bacterium]|nr:HIT domain-containing protein [Candidatus Lindowbacteria bacterium]